MQRQLAAGLFFATGGQMLAYIFATEWVDYNLPGSIGYDYLVKNVLDLQRRDEGLFTQVWLIFLFCAIGGFAFGAHFASEALTQQGKSKWQSLSQMRRNKLLGKPGTGFILAKTTRPSLPGRFVTSDKYPNCLIVAPTGAGKGVGFVYPNLLTFEGSTVTLDIKGENYETTARWRSKMGNKVYKFAPVQFGQASHRYNPLERIGKLSTYGQINFELRKIATLFLQADGAGEWLNGAIQLFCVIGGVAHERRDFTLGGIYRVLSEGEDNLQKHLKVLSQGVREPALRRELASLAKLEQRTLSSYMSVMNNAGFDLWSNPHVDDMTSASDFSFDNIRREKTSIYFIVSDGDLKPLAGLVRLFFNELVSTIQARKPGKDEPYHAMLILDEFHRLGKMSEVAEAMTTIRGFNGRIAIITQTIPKLDSIYSYEERLSIQGGAGLKLYMTPSEEMTIEDLSNAVGMTTKRTVTRSKQAGLGQRATFTERTDEKPLLTEDDARRLPEDVSIIIVNGKQPVKVKAIVHWKDQRFKKILKKQEQLGWDFVDKSLLQSRIDNIERRTVRPQLAGSASITNQKGKEQQAAPEGPTTENLKQLAALAPRILDMLDSFNAIQDREDKPNTDVVPTMPEVVARTKKTGDRTKLAIMGQAQLDLGDMQIEGDPVEDGNESDDKKMPPKAA
jgi:type IV secretion system protein VirD4